MSMILQVHTQILIKQLATEKGLIRFEVTGLRREEIQKYWVESVQHFQMKD